MLYKKDDQFNNPKTNITISFIRYFYFIQKVNIRCLKNIANT